MYKDDCGGVVIYMGLVYLYEGLLFKLVYVVVKYVLFGLNKVLVKEGVVYNVCLYVVCFGFVCMLLVEK